MDIKRKKRFPEKTTISDLSSNLEREGNLEDDFECRVYRFGQTFDIDKENDLIQKRPSAVKREYPARADLSKRKVNKNSFEFVKVPQVKPRKKKKKSLYFYVLVFLTVSVLTGGFFYYHKGLDTQKKVLGVSRDAYQDVNSAIEGAKNQDFALSADKFKSAYENFSRMAESLEGLGKGVIDISRFMPGASKLSSGYYLTQAGKNLSLAGEKISRSGGNFEELKNRAKRGEDSEVSVLEIFKTLDADLSEIRGYLNEAQNNLDKVKIEDLPLENQSEIASLKAKLPVINDLVKNFFDNSHIVADFLGANGARKYLFLFQNNQEMRPTGGFIGSYGVLDIDGSGRIRNFFIDGIFNPDGQLLDKVVPPKPIQKISVAWSLHDSNWFPDFPLSAQKAMLFYEKTGGPTVDGVITLTPTVIQKLFDITGPIEMPEYGVTLTKENFIQNIQYEVEVDYDKEENRPKKILSDLAPIILDRISQTKDAGTILATMDILNEALKEKHILLYFTNEELQSIISSLGWSGEVLAANDDYLSVINTNINGFKTDGVVEEKIFHEVKIHSNGEIIDTVSINRKHLGGKTDYEWWNKVNADYMRVYVPEGAELLAVEGQTREINEDVVDYQSLNYEFDPDVKNEEVAMKIDSRTGTRIYNERGKTVFANWVYVSPQEEVTIKYRYKLPFKYDGDIKSYSFMAQKQSGSPGSKFELSVKYPKGWSLNWQNEELRGCDSEDDNMKKICFSGDLRTDKFLGAVFTEK
ncbi:MAG: DUF4012 domain-containing protein [Candidatus Moraniibacteriota bacterium]